MSKKILVYFGDYIEKRAIVERVLSDVSIPFQVLSDEDLLDTTGYLMELEDFQAHTSGQAKHYKSDVMILKGIEDEEILTINALLATKDIKMSRKAMLTEHNQHWSVADLLNEIEKEHRYFQQVDKIKAILNQSSSLIIAEYTNSSWTIYEQAFYHAYQCISKDATPEEVEQAYQTLQQAKQQLEKI